MEYEIKELDGMVSLYHAPTTAWIPVDTANRDYQAFLIWLKTGNGAGFDWSKVLIK